MGRSNSLIYIRLYRRQLAWQVGGLAFLWAVASPQSKTENDRHEEKLDLILQKLDPQNAKKILQELETKYPKK